MKRLVSFALMLFAFCLTSKGQIREIFDDGEVFERYHSGIILDLGAAMFSYRLTYGRYPDDKKVLLDYFLETSKDEYDDDKIISILTERDSVYTVDLTSPENVLVVSGDTCTFSYARPAREYTFTSIEDSVVVRRLSAVQCIGGPMEQQIKDYYSFRSWSRSRAYDKNGRCLWPLCSESLMMPREINRQFRYVVTMENESEETMRLWDFPPVLVPITVTRSGTISYGKDIARLGGVQLYYQELGNPFSSKSAIGTITLEEALDLDRLDAIKAFMKSYFDEHEDVERMSLWELVLFNNPPVVAAEQ